MSPLPVVLTCDCGARYDVSARSPGARVRCRRCDTLLVVPRPHAEPPERAGVRSASERLMRLRGTPCERHPRELVALACEKCGRRGCERCRAEPPHDHLCRDCARAWGVAPLLAVDFGFFSTLGTAARIFARAFGPRLVAYNVLIHATVLVLFILGLWPLYELNEAAKEVSERAVRDAYFSLVNAGGAVLLVASLSFLAILLASGNATFMDGALRGEPAAVGRALVRAIHRLPAATAAWGLLAASLVVPLVALEIPLLALSALLDRQGIAALGAVVYVPVALPIAASLVLAGPIAVLEERSGAGSIARAFQLARRHLVALSALIAVLLLVQLGVTTATAGVGQLASPGVSYLVAGVVGFLFDVAWPALLVAAYHGLAAEAEGVPGRR